MKKSTRKAVRWIVYVVVLFFLFVLQSTPGLFSVFGTRPLLLLPFAVCLSMRESERNAAIIGVLAGVLWDTTSSKLFGFSSLILLVCCVSCALLVMYLIKCNLMNTVLLCAATLVLYLCLDFVFYYAIWGFSHLGTVLLSHMLPIAVYTMLLTPLFYWLAKTIDQKLTDPMED